MKHIGILTLTGLLFGIASCESTIDLGEDGMGTVLMMNAQLCTSDSTHVVSLASNMQDGIFPLSKAEIECYVNNTLVSKSDFIEETVDMPVSEGMTYGQGVSLLRLDAHFKPGDEVCIKANSGNMSCEAVILVPSAPEILDVTVTDCVTETDLESGDKKFEITVKDIQGEINYYSFKLLDRSYVQVKKSNDFSPYHPGDILNSNKVEVPVNTTKEPLVNSGERTIGSFFEKGDSYFDNKLHLFTDYLFRDGSYKMTVYSKKGFNTKPETMESGEIFVAYNIATIRLLNYSKEGYLYLTGYQFDNSIEGGTYITNDFIYPSNVTGGLGFVSICSSLDYDVLLSSVQYDDTYFNV